MTTTLTHGHGHGHSLPEAPDGVMGYVGGVPIPRALLDERLAALRAGDAACVLPRPDSREGRQLTRWVAQVVLTEQLCADELSRRGDAGPGNPAGTLDVSTAIAVGSITAAALAGSEAVRRVAELVSADVRISSAQLAYAADVLGEEPPADPDVPTQKWHAELLDSARLEAFARWLNAAMHERVRLVHGLEHPGDSNQPDNLHRH
jgi:[acyl-carrier-protein] S-malonyltransferase